MSTVCVREIGSIMLLHDRLRTGVCDPGNAGPRHSVVGWQDCLSSARPPMRQKIHTHVRARAHTQATKWANEQTGFRAHTEVSSCNTGVEVCEDNTGVDRRNAASGKYTTQDAVD